MFNSDLPKVIRSPRCWYFGQHWPSRLPFILTYVQYLIWATVFPNAFFISNSTPFCFLHAFLEYKREKSIVMQVKQYSQDPSTCPWRFIYKRTLPLSCHPLFSPFPWQQTGWTVALYIVYRSNNCRYYKLSLCKKDCQSSWVWEILFVYSTQCFTSMNTDNNGINPAVRNFNIIYE